MASSSASPASLCQRPASAGARERPGAALQQWDESCVEQKGAACRASSAVAVAADSDLQQPGASPAVLHLNVVASEAVCIHFLPPQPHRPGTAPPAAASARCFSGSGTAPPLGVPASAQVPVQPGMQEAAATPDVWQLNAQDTHASAPAASLDQQHQRQQTAGQAQQHCAQQQQQQQQQQLHGAARVVPAECGVKGQQEEGAWQGDLQGQQDEWSPDSEGASFTEPPPLQLHWRQQEHADQQQQQQQQQQPQRPALTTAGPGRRPPTPSAAPQLQAGPAQAHHADEAVAAERGARLAAEAEVAQLAALLEDQQRSWQEQAAEWQGQLRVAQSALQALQGKVASLHAELAAEQALRQAAEQEAEAARQREAQLLARLAQAEQRQQEQRQQEGQPQQGLQKTQGAQAHAEVQASAGGSSRGEAAGVPDAAQLHSMLLQLQQEVAALRFQRAPQHAPPARPPAPAMAAVDHGGNSGQAGLPEFSAYLPAPAMPAAPGDNAPRAWQEQAQAQGWRHAPPGWLQPMPPQPQQLPSLASRQQQQQALGAASAGGPDRPAGVTQQRLAEVRSWLQQQEQEQQEPTGHAQLPLQRSPQRQQSVSLHPLQQPSPQCAASPTRARTPLHEPRSPPCARPGSARRRLLQGTGGSGTGHNSAAQSGTALNSTGDSSSRGLLRLQPPARWDYRPAWNEGTGRSTASFASTGHTSRSLPRVDDLPMARARQAEAGGAPTSQAVAAQQEAGAQQHQQEQPWQQPLHPGQQQHQQAWQHEQQPARAAHEVGEQSWQPGQQQSKRTLQEPGSLPAFFPPATGVGSPPGMPIIHQYFAAPSSPPPAAPPAFGQALDLCGGSGGAYAAAADPASRPTSTSSYGLQYQLLLQPAPPQGPPAWQHQLWQHHQQQQQQQWQSVQQSEPKQHQPDGQLRQQQQQRPATPASGLSCRAHEHSAIVGSEALQPRAVSPRPRSASAKDKPLAVPPTQVDAGALAAARAEYVQEKERIRAKRLRELADSPGFSLQ